MTNSDSIFGTPLSSFEENKGAETTKIEDESLIEALVTQGRIKEAEALCQENSEFTMSLIRAASKAGRCETAYNYIGRLEDSQKEVRLFNFDIYFIVDRISTKSFCVT